MHHYETVFNFPLLEDLVDIFSSEVPNLKDHETSERRPIPNGFLMNNLSYYGPPRNVMNVDPKKIYEDPFFCPRMDNYVNVFEKEPGTSMKVEEFDLNGGDEREEERGDGDHRRSGEREELLMDVKEEAVMENESDCETNDDETLKRKGEELDVLPDFKLEVSKSPIMEAMACCAVQGWGLIVEECKAETNDSPACVKFKVIDFDKYCRYSSQICSKQNPTEDICSRVKSIRRWFTNFPKKKDRKDNSQFTLEVKPEVSTKVHDMVERHRCKLNVKKRRRMK